MYGKNNKKNLLSFDRAHRAAQGKLYLNFENAKIKKLWPVESYGWLWWLFIENLHMKIFLCKIRNLFLFR